MGTFTNLLLCSFFVGVAPNKVTLEADRPLMRVHVFHRAELECCFNTAVKPVRVTWTKTSSNFTQTVAKKEEKTESGKQCGTLTIDRVQLSDSGLYKCVLNGSKVNLISHGTYLQVYKSLEKTINLSESTKNKIVTAEGVLLLLCVILPSVTLLLKSKRLHQLDKKKTLKEEENIYQGLNLDDCVSTYDQIERSQSHGPYQDVGNVKEEEERIQLEKP